MRKSIDLHMSGSEIADEYISVMDEKTDYAAQVTIDEEVPCDPHLPQDDNSISENSKISY